MVMDIEGRVILFIVYFLLLWPLGLAFKLTGNSAKTKNFTHKSYWIETTSPTISPIDYARRQF
jgi:hypothetical protein